MTNRLIVKIVSYQVMANSFVDMFRAQIDVYMEEAANEEYPGRNRIEMMANPVLWSTPTHISDMEWITLRSICGNSVGYGGYRTSCGIEEITAELRQLTGNKAISMQTVVAILLEMNVCVFVAQSSQNI